MGVVIMSTMNKKRGTMKQDTKTTVNHSGSKVHKLNALESLFARVLGSFFGESTYYEKRSAEQDFKDTQALISQVSNNDIEYVLKIAQIGREYNMISYPLALLTICFNDDRFKGTNSKLKVYSDRIIRRGKDILDTMAMQLSMYGKPLPMQFRKCLKYKLETFNDYQLSKSLGKNKDVSLATCIRLLRPNPKTAKVSKDFFKRVLDNEVSFGDGVEQVQSAISKVNNTNNTTTKEDIIKSLDTSSVMAIVKNLVALYNQGVLLDSEAVKKITDKLTNKREVEKSKLLPFRFYSAYTEVLKLNSFRYKIDIIDALVKALDLSIYNLKNIDGYNAILIDRSGSMNHKVSSASGVTADIVACMLGAICFKKGNADVFVFGSSCHQVSGLSRKSTVLDIMKSIMGVSVGCTTYLDRAVNFLFSHGVKYDGLIILSDNDCYSEGKYGFEFDSDMEINRLFDRKIIKKVFLNNLLGNTFAIVNTDDYRKNLITGFSERIVDVINVYSTLGNKASDIRKVIDSIYGNLPKR